ncbi:hypothetical protein EI555_005914, partial [Monodon monoceros]
LHDHLTAVPTSGQVKTMQAKVFYGMVTTYGVVNAEYYQKVTDYHMSQKSIFFHAISSKDFLQKSVVKDAVLIEHQKGSMPAYYKEAL